MIWKELNSSNIQHYQDLINLNNANQKVDNEICRIRKRKILLRRIRYKIKHNQCVAMNINIHQIQKQYKMNW